ncbi:hypothetical protein BN2476_270014 [Paraburkholderia piptadeniae]|uniref:Uncharacterized protein n=1 Tax=Paraburkholderia piptadeniae TaxID=1701573 RepID=A0A1N7S1G8_9BURK|nr:hypothetical protein [Paraburkholderia piptadeniae]SIT41184.1 hypothetical protein BN2476_270014 [Paraburkholderia piptadeniae]
MKQRFVGCVDGGLREPVQHTIPDEVCEHAIEVAADEWNEWKVKRNHFYGHLKLPQDPKEFLGPLIKHLDRSLNVQRDATMRGDVHIDSAVHLDPLSVQASNPALEALRRAIFSASPDGQLPEIILEIHSATRFSSLLLGREPRSRVELLMVYAAVLARGTSLTAGRHRTHGTGTGFRDDQADDEPHCR